MEMLDRLNDESKFSENATASDQTCIVSFILLSRRANPCLPLHLTKQRLRVFHEASVDSGGDMSVVVQQCTSRKDRLQEGVRPVFAEPLRRPRLPGRRQEA